MKYCYNVSIADSTGRMQLYVCVCATMDAAVAWAQNQAGVTSDPMSVSNITPQGISYIETP